MAHPTVIAVSLDAIRAAHGRLEGIAVRTPVVRCAGGGNGREVFLKLDNLQPTGSFKIRPIGSAVLTRSRKSLNAGVYTASSGNSALALAWFAQRLGISSTAIVAPGAPRAKLSRLRELDARILEVSLEEWWRTVGDCGRADLSGTYIDAVRDPAALAGDGTLGVEVLEELCGVEAIFTPFGGGALACGVACAIRALSPQVKVIACELETAQPFGAALRAGCMVQTESRPGFVSGVGFHTLLPEMWPLARDLIDGALTVSLPEVAAAIRLLAERNQVIAEGAGAIPVAAALSERHPYRRVCAIVSGGNLGTDMLSAILAGAVPA